jgi:predicted RNA-binding protein associated with RNAse of E/G family
VVVRKHLDRPYWARILEKKFAYLNINEPDFNGCVSIIYIEKVTSPLVKNMRGKKYVLADSGYFWLQFLPSNQNYSLTTTYDVERNIVQWYFDITLKNATTEESIPYFDDLFLDIVVIPGEEPILIDEDDLEEALRSNAISKEQFNLAYIHAHMLLRTLASDQKKLTELSEKYSKIMLNELGKRS